MEITRMANRPTISISPGSTVFEALKAMHEHRISSVVVQSRIRLEGIFTLRDLARKVALEEIDLYHTPVEEVMTTDVKSVRGSTSIADAVRIMLDKHIHHLPVIGKNGQVDGMVSLDDLLASTIDDLQNEVASLDAYIGCDGPGG